jgi:putative ABC transport system substrate-binding protein
MASYIRRRKFLATLGGAAAAWPLAARAQQRDQPARVGILTLGGAPANPLFAAFRQEMHGLGYVEGRNLVLEFRSAADDPKRLPELAAELVRLSVKVMLVEGTAAARAAKEATSSIPIVMGVVAEPMEAGLVSNLARPGGNITGFTSLTPELGTKRLGLLKEAFPDITRVGVLRNPRNPGNAQQLATRVPIATRRRSGRVATCDARSNRTWVRRIGVLVNEPWPALEGLHEGLTELGSGEDQNLLIELPLRRRRRGAVSWTGRRRPRAILRADFSGDCFGRRSRQSRG